MVREKDEPARHREPHYWPSFIYSIKPLCRSRSHTHTWESLLKGCEIIGLECKMKAKEKRVTKTLKSSAETRAASGSKRRKTVSVHGRQQDAESSQTCACQLAVNPQHPPKAALCKVTNTLTHIRGLLVCRNATETKRLKQAPRGRPFAPLTQQLLHKWIRTNGCTDRKHMEVYWWTESLQQMKETPTPQTTATGLICCFCSHIKKIFIVSFWQMNSVVMKVLSHIKTVRVI